MAQSIEDICKLFGKYEKNDINEVKKSINKIKIDIVGIGVTANESRLDARQVIEQINLARQYGFAGEALFDLDTTLEKSVLPYLRLGIW